ncbi:NUDIX domain-containing protein, partial [Candidatus Peregrinibacteria bacterium]|nr:NUDIX domain-containing protein [Candidatus Peregrinibacteria bacterium]
MHRNWLKQKLENYQPTSPKEAESLVKILDLLEHHPQCFDRSYYTPGHITASAWIVNQDRTKVLLHKHRKFNKWLQLGGHSDSHPLTNEVALREAEEESGLQSVKLV